MSDDNGTHQGYEDIPATVPAVASKDYLLSQILDRLAALEEREKVREERLAVLEEENAALREEIALERAYDRRRITALETPAPALSQKTAGDHLDKLFSEMKRQGIRQTTTRDAARFIGISKSHMQKLKPYLAADMRFSLLIDPHRTNRYLIRLV